MLLSERARTKLHGATKKAKYHTAYRFHTHLWKDAKISLPSTLTLQLRIHVKVTSCLWQLRISNAVFTRLFLPSLPQTASLAGLHHHHLTTTSQTFARAYQNMSNHCAKQAQTCCHRITSRLSLNTNQFAASKSSQRLTASRDTPPARRACLKCRVVSQSVHVDSVDAWLPAVLPIKEEHSQQVGWAKCKIPSICRNVQKWTHFKIFN